MPPKTGTSTADRALAHAVVRWFSREARDLPWRRAVDADGRRSPYACLVSELMLQQTQVSRVRERFEQFLQRFPTLAHLARATEDDVLAQWSGLGYYRRARLLHSAAKQVADRHDGEFPQDPKSILALPGVGRYTAGAIASIAFGLPEPIVDGNVTRVLMRLSARRGKPDSAQNQAWVWRRAQELVSAALPAAGPFNEGLMELGATVCTPAKPECGRCPLRGTCEAYQKGLQTRIPPPKARAATPSLLHVCLLIRDGSGRVLAEQRPPTGLWARLWQAPTIEADPAQREAIVRWLTSSEVQRAWGRLQRVETFQRTLTHRLITFEVWAGEPVRSAAGQRRREAAPASWPCVAASPVPARRWLTREELLQIGLSTPQRRVLLGS
jgi:A/G-specific adenine glycosylase